MVYSIIKVAKEKPFVVKGKSNDEASVIRILIDAFCFGKLKLRNYRLMRTLGNIPGGKIKLKFRY